MTHRLVKGSGGRNVLYLDVACWEVSDEVALFVSDHMTSHCMIRNRMIIHQDNLKLVMKRNYIVN